MNTYSLIPNEIFSSQYYEVNIDELVPEEIVILYDGKNVKYMRILENNKKTLQYEMIYPKGYLIPRCMKTKMTGMRFYRKNERYDFDIFMQEQKKINKPLTPREKVLYNLQTKIGEYLGGIEIEDICIETRCN
jgi:hypothetical protein